jgi:hypothetical protein
MLEGNPFSFQGTSTWRKGIGLAHKAIGFGWSGTETWRKGIGFKGAKQRVLGGAELKPWRKATGFKCKGTGLGFRGTEPWRKATIACFKRTLMCSFAQHKRCL